MYLRAVLDWSDDPRAIEDRIARAVERKLVQERELVLRARDLIADHNKSAWSYRVDVVTGVTPYKTLGCGCRDCERLTPIARLLLPEEAGCSIERRPERRAVVLRGDEWAVLSGNQSAA